MKAFPSIAFDSIGQITSLEDGMNLRDYFAAKAMQALINEKHWHDPEGGIHEISIADDSYRIADLMMKVRME